MRGIGELYSPLISFLTFINIGQNAYKPQTGAAEI